MTLQVETLETSFDLIAPRGDEVVDRFYSRLFATDQRIRHLFDNVDMARQKQSLLNTLVVVRESLHDLSDVIPDLQALGARHAGWGVRPADYPIVIQCLLATMKEVGGSDWKPEYTDAWAEALETVQSVMLEGAAQVAP
jgi:hemoglobin-like flavoprotein